MQDMSDSAQSAKRATPRSKIASAVFAVPRRIHSHVSSRTTSELYGVAKTAIVILAGVLPTVIGFVIVLQAMLHTPILMTPIIRVKQRPSISSTRLPTSTASR
jgi:hypothetical protein